MGGERGGGLVIYTLLGGKVIRRVGKTLLARGPTGAKCAFLDRKHGFL